ncbi:MAG: FtsX-like permease family protein, partial [Acidobacteriota bacterium]
YSVPIGFNSTGGRVYLEGRSDSSAEEEDSFLMLYNLVSSDYFATMGVALLKGRPITEQDSRESRPVAVVNQFMAEQMWPQREAIGQRFSLDNPEGPFMEVVGVVQNGFYSVPGEAYKSFFYIPQPQQYRSARVLFIDSDAAPAALLPSIRREIAALDPDMPVFDVRTLRSHVEDGKAAILFGLPSALVGAFALIGLVLAATGLYGVISYSVTQRTHEIGVRVALGATTGSIVRLISKKGLWLAGVGIVLGCAAALAVTGMFANLLIGVSARDPITYAGVSGLLLLLALAASALPARFRAAAIDPVDALRGE